MPKRTETPFDFQAKSAELDTVLARLQDPAIQVDEAMTCYEQGLKLVDELEVYLKQAENVVRRHAPKE